VPVWQAKNVANDELDLQVPIWDTDSCFIENKVVATCTAYGDVREYHIRKQKKPTKNAKIIAEGKLLSKLVKSKKNENLLYIVN
jgi:ribosome biogenesis protein NSA1